MLKTFSLLFHQLLQQIQLTAFTFVEYLANTSLSYRNFQEQPWKTGKITVGHTTAVKVSALRKILGYRNFRPTGYSENPDISDKTLTLMISFLVEIFR